MIYNTSYKQIYPYKHKEKVKVKVGELPTSEGELTKVRQRRENAKVIAKVDFVLSKYEANLSSEGKLFTSEGELLTCEGTTNFQLDDLSGPPYSLVSVQQT